MVWIQLHQLYHGKRIEPMNLLTYSRYCLSQFLQIYMIKTKQQN